MNPILRTAPPPFDNRLIVMLNREFATAKQGFASLAAYTARTLPAWDAKLADWQSGKLSWCYVEEVPALVDLALAPPATSDTALRSELSAAREQIAALETRIAAARNALSIQ